MITGELKNKMDKIWTTIFTGGLSTPSSVIEQITYLMFMKLLDDNELKKEGNASTLGMEYKSKIFLDGEFQPDENIDDSIPYKELRWNTFKNYEPNQMYNVVRNYAFPFIKTVGGEGKDTAFAKFISEAVFLLDSPKVLAVCVDELSNLDISNKDIMGDVYEYCLGKMASSGNLGQFRTPRHIIDMMVKMVKPQLDDVIMDPAMGSAGFLLGSAKYLKDNYSKELLNKDNLEHYNKKMFSGYDTDPTMLRLGAMNMLLHAVEEPTIEKRDSLSEDNQIRDYYSLILANPPFKGSVFEEDISKDILATCKTKKTELLFLALFIKSLKIGGRCACIVPDGVLFGSSKAHKDIRKELIDNNRLQAVISMPSGVFKPYAGVSTAVLIFTKDPAGTDDVWFYDMKNDGFSLDDKRSEIDENDIPDILERYANLDKEKDRKRTEQSFYVSSDEIKENDYDLSINKYKEIEYIPVEYPPTEEIIEEIKQIEKKIETELIELEKMLK